MEWVLFLTWVVSTAWGATADDAKQFMLEGNRKKAIHALDQILKDKGTASPKPLIKQRELYLKQFVTTPAFQFFEEARSLAQLKRFDEALRKVDKIDERDQDNLLVLELKMNVLWSLSQQEPLETTVRQTLDLVPTHFSAHLFAAELAYLQQKAIEGLQHLEDVSGGYLSADANAKERYVILKASLLKERKKISEAIEILKRYVESNPQSLQATYKLAQLYQENLNPILAKKMFALFLSRCKPLSSLEIQHRGMEKWLIEAKNEVSKN